MVSNIVNSQTGSEGIILPSSAQAQASARLSWYYCQSQTDPDRPTPTRPEKYVSAIVQSRRKRQSCKIHLEDSKKVFIRTTSPNYCQAQPKLELQLG